MGMVIENEGTGFIFLNDTDNEKAPAYTGQVNVNGEQMRIALWWKQFKNGEGFSVNLQPAEGNFDNDGGDDGDDEADDEPQARRTPPARNGGSSRSSGRSSSRSSSANRGSAQKASAKKAPAKSYRKPTRRK